jgi:hypothetical protein
VHTSPTTLSQLLALVTVWKESGYNQSVEGHGKQQVIFGASSVHILPGISGGFISGARPALATDGDSQPVVILTYSSSWRKGT